MSTRIKGVDFRLEAEAVIQGSVVDPERKPVKASVAAVRKETREDSSQGLLTVSTIRTDVEVHFTLNACLQEHISYASTDRKGSRCTRMQALPIRRPGMGQLPPSKARFHFCSTKDSSSRDCRSRLSESGSSTSPFALPVPAKAR